MFVLSGPIDDMLALMQILAAHLTSNDGLFFWHIFVSLGFNELTESYWFDKKIPFNIAIDL